ncbi:hypothetical protein BJ165DRAFT_1404211 [Panaeolus papilionaceus]|nr:hypothetical protein BJ165DRAFT_1404211 [Panaeolus papilionaceus]
MTRSSKAAPSARTVFNKTVRAEAHAKGITFAAARTTLPAGIHVSLVGNHQLGTGPNGIPCNCDSDYRSTARPRGRGSYNYNSKLYISGPQIDDGALEVEDEDVYDFSVDFSDTPALPQPTSHSVSLFDLARPAKKRGPAKEFEVVPRLRNVLALEDDDDIESFYLASTSGGDDEWERISDEQSLDNRKSYSAVLRGPDT